MKYLILFILAPIWMIAQNSTHSYQVDKKTAIYNDGAKEIDYNFHPLLVDNGVHTMIQDTLTYNGANYTYKRNHIVVDGITFKFNKPWFSNKTRLVNKTNGKLLATYVTDHKEHSVEVFKNEDNYKELDQKTKDVVDTWSTFKQVQYVHYNAKSGDPFDPILMGLIAGLLSTY